MKFTIPYLTAVLFSRVEGKAEGRIVNGQAGDIGSQVPRTALCSLQLIAQPPLKLPSTTSERGRIPTGNGPVDQTDRPLGTSPRKLQSNHIQCRYCRYCRGQQSSPDSLPFLDTSGMAKEGISLHLDGWGLTQAGGTVKPQPIGP
ncbi:hypothetical protein DSO57_1037785 [Entomophthora muscae]|uniref:Uncharacterized protein n=1 Tax=Entomophthora muscae TaxID=34485 RepID=A0ACC2RPU3_9FUNG|nr:hypothetical protein DSO57_1037785 [Entomophthora muscae]